MHGTAAAGESSIAIGVGAMGGSLVTGNDNIAIGTSSMDALLGGACNIAIGKSAGGAVTTGCYNIGIGNGAGASATTLNCTINIGNGADQNTVGVACIQANCLMTACFYETSDCRSKCNIKDLPYGLDLIKLLRPVSYKWKPQPDKLDKDGNLIEEGEKSHTGPRASFGLLGQEVKGALEKLGLGYNDFGAYSDKEVEHGPSGWKPSYQEENKTVGLSYIGFIAPLIKSVQELSAEVDSLKAQLKTT